MSKTFTKGSLTGGAAGALDEIDADELSDGDRAFVVTTSDVLYVYVLDADSAVSESSPDVIAPDTGGGAAYAGDKRWELCDIYFTKGIIVGAENAARKILNIKTFNLVITDAITASCIDLNISSSGTGYDMSSASITNLGKSGADSGFSLNAGGTELTLDGTTIFGGDTKGVISAWITKNLTTSTLLPGLSYGSSDLVITIRRDTENNGADLTVLVDESIGTINVFGCVLILEA